MLSYTVWFITLVDYTEAGQSKKELFRYLFTDEFVKNPTHEILDMRDNIHPKKSYKEYDPFFEPHPYKQVFDDRHGFVPNLSILDLLFNKGPESRLVLEQSYRKADVK